MLGQVSGETAENRMIQARQDDRRATVLFRHVLRASFRSTMMRGDDDVRARRLVRKDVAFRGGSRRARGSRQSGR
jgi:hypothetical protein